MEIYLNEFGKKFIVKTTNKVMKATYRTQLKMAKAEDITDKEPVEQIQQSLNMTEAVEGYLKEVLGLTEEDLQVLDELEFMPTIDLVNHVILRVMGLTEDEINEAGKEKGKK